MLVLRRKEGQWIEVTHRSGEVIRFRVYNLLKRPGQVDLAFDDEPCNFKIQRPERGKKLAAVATGEGATNGSL